MSLLTRRRRRSTTEPDQGALAGGDTTSLLVPRSPEAGCSPIAQARWRGTVRVAGRVRSVRVQPWADVPALECTLVDDSGGLAVVFLGRRKVGGVRPGARMMVDGIVGEHHGRLAMLNPDYSLLEATSG